jgi:hypothetical protein
MLGPVRAVAASGTGTLALAPVRRAHRGVRPRRDRLRGHGPAGAAKHARKPWVKEPWGLPAPSAECVARRADRLAWYEDPDDPRRPRGGFDARPCPLLADRRGPPPPVSGGPTRVDGDDPRPGTCQLFLMREPLQGWRHVTVTARRPTRAWAQGMAAWVEGSFPEAETIRVVLAHLPPPTGGAR